MKMLEEFFTNSRVAMVIIGVVGIVLAEVVPSGEMLHFDGATIRILFTTLGSILIGTTIIEGAFQARFHNRIREEVNALADNITTLQETVMIAKGAVDAGLTAVYATRGECLSKIEEKLKKRAQ
jgi:hypothetical protein